MQGSSEETVVRSVPVCLNCCCCCIRAANANSNIDGDRTNPNINEMPSPTKEQDAVPWKLPTHGWGREKKGTCAIACSADAVKDKAEKISIYAFERQV